jgi:transcriptional regulator with XRE-family HTH domain
MDASILGERILLRRRKLNLTQIQLGKAVGISGNTIARIERGLLQDLKGQVVVRLARELGSSTDYLFGLTDNPEPIGTEAREHKKRNERSAARAAQQGAG